MAKGGTQAVDRWLLHRHQPSCHPPDRWRVPPSERRSSRSRNSFSFIQTGLALRNWMNPFGVTPRYDSRIRSNLSKGLS